MKSGKFRWLRRIPSAPKEKHQPCCQRCPYLLQFAHGCRPAGIKMSIGGFRKTDTSRAMPRKVIASVENPAATSSTNEIEPIEPCRNSYSCTVEIESCQSFYDANTARSLLTLHHGAGRWWKQLITSEANQSLDPSSEIRSCT